eukprot:GHVH01000233.1.p1 GENE.GHVH01000233.1~~GHVH01000233.1.p1  ORF type:complete len:133 (+),score=19.22 GHVH01000233.1:25-423(+)
MLLQSPPNPSEMDASVLVVYGPSGVGKGTLLNKLREEFKQIKLSVSHTTRASREGERDSIEYNFVEKDTFQKLVEDGAFIEHASFAGNDYGTTFTSVDKIVKDDPQGIVLLEIETNGVKQVAESNLHSVAQI